MRKIFAQREQFGDFNKLMSELQNDREQFFRYLRMSPERFSHLLSLVKGKITKQNTRFRKSITAEERLAVTFSQKSKQKFMCSHSTYSAALFDSLVNTMKERRKIVAHIKTF